MVGRCNRSSLRDTKQIRDNQGSSSVTKKAKNKEKIMPGDSDMKESEK